MLIAVLFGLKENNLEIVLCFAAEYLVAYQGVGEAEQINTFEDNEAKFSASTGLINMERLGFKQPCGVN